jgi:xanthine dehydrogenase accessory factor
VSRAEIDQRVTTLRAERVPFVHATVVHAERPTSAKPGDAAVVHADGTIEGFVGGTCAESTVRAQSLALLDSGEPLLLRITPEPETAEAVPGTETDTEHGTGHGPAPDRLTVHNPCLSGGTLEIFLEPVAPAPLLVVHGESPIAQALAGLGERLGYQVRSGDSSDPTGAAAVVCASHGRDEEEVLARALGAAVPYVALVASRKRGEAVVASLAVDEAVRARVHTPAGLDIGARTPEEVALSVLAEMVAERRRPSGRPVQHSEHPGTEAAPARPATAIDPVCGMSVATVETSLHLDHEGTRYWFCGTGCLRAFAADPAGYLVR